MGLFKINNISRNPLDYSILFLGESGIGKTTLMYEMCKKLTGKYGYGILNVGKEDGIRCIQGVAYIDVPNWASFDKVVKELCSKRETEYKDLKVIVIDTVDELFEIGEVEVIRRYNAEKMGEKDFVPVKSINAAYGGYGAGLAELERLVLGAIWKIKQAGIMVWMIGHVKSKEVMDVYTNQSYVNLSAALSQKYFNAIRTKVQLVGMAIIDRNIVSESTGRKDINKRDVKKNVVKSEARKILFRDDNYGIDSKGRFRYIVDQIPFDSDEFIKAIRDAIDKEIESKEDEDVSQVDDTQEMPLQLEEDESNAIPFDEETSDDGMEEESNSDDSTEEAEENVTSDKTDEEMIAEIKSMFKTASQEIKTKVKEIIINAGYQKFDQVTRKELDEIAKLFSDTE